MAITSECGIMMKNYPMTAFYGDDLLDKSFIVKYLMPRGSGNRLLVQTNHGVTSVCALNHAQHGQRGQINEDDFNNAWTVFPAAMRRRINQK